MNYKDLLTAVQSAAGLRLRLKLQPLYGPGEIVFPCTVAGGKYQISKRRIPCYDESIDCAIMDSVQSQANRMEDALLADIRAGHIHLPHVVTDFSGIEGDLEKPVGSITCFEAPHRIFDAILRDSVDGEGKHFPLTETGIAVSKANAHDACAIFGVSPASLLFGSWDSTGLSGGLGEKYTRCVVSEVIGVNVERGVRAGTRIDPLNMEKGQSPDVVLKETKDEMLAILKKSGRKFDKPSEINHSSVPWDGGTEASPHGGVTCDYLQQSTTISFAALRQLHFPVAGEEKGELAQAVLAGMALHAAVPSVERGWHLRSRCDLILDDGQAVEWELLGSEPKKEALKAEDTRKVLMDAIEAAKKAGLPWRDEPLRLAPSNALQQLVIKSQKAHRTASAES